MVVQDLELLNYIVIVIIINNNNIDNNSNNIDDIKFNDNIAIT